MRRTVIGIEITEGKAQLKKICNGQASKFSL